MLKEEFHLLSEHKISIDRIDSHDFDESFDFCIFLTVVNEHMLHIGLLAKDPEDDQIYFIHQPWHKEPLKEHFSPEDKTFKICCMSNLIKVERETFLTQLFPIIESNPNGLPYSINYRPYDYLDESGQLVNLEVGEGLTCATFILELMKNLGYPLIKSETWMIREEDQKWRDFILKCLKSSCEEQHITNQYVEQTARFRPEEVAAAAAIYNRTEQEFREIEPIGKQIKEFTLNSGPTP